LIPTLGFVERFDFGDGGGLGKGLRKALKGKTINEENDD